MTFFTLYYKKYLLYTLFYKNDVFFCLYLESGGDLCGADAAAGAWLLPDEATRQPRPLLHQAARQSRPLLQHQAGLGICFLVFCKNRSFLDKKERIVALLKRVIRSLLFVTKKCYINF